MRLNLFFVFIFVFLTLAFTENSQLQAEDDLTVTPTVGPLTPSQTIQPLSDDLSEDKPVIPSFYIWRREYQKGKKTHYKLFKVYEDGAYGEEGNPTETYENWVQNVNPGGGTPKGLGNGPDILTSPSKKWSIQQSTEAGNFILRLFQESNAVPQNIMIPDRGGSDDSDHWWWEGVDWNPVRDLFYLTICIGTSTDRQFIYWQFDPTVKSFINVGTGQDLFLSPDGNWAVWMDGFWGDWRRDQLHIYDIAKNKNYQITSGDSDNVFYKWTKPAIAVTTGTTAKDFIKDGKAAYLQHYYPEAIAQYQKAIKIDSNNAEAYSLLGYSQFRYGQLDEATTSLKQSLKIDPNFIMSHYNLALVYWAIGKTEQAYQNAAFREMDTVIQIDPKYEKLMRDDTQFGEIFKSDAYEKWALRKRGGIVTRIVESNPEVMEFMYNNCHMDQDHGTSMEAANNDSEQKNGRYVVEVKLFTGPPGAVHDYTPPGEDKSTFWAFDWNKRKLKKLSAPDDIKGVEVPYSKCLFANVEVDSSSSGSSNLPNGGLIEETHNWCSAETNQDHWIHEVFDRPETLQELRLFFPNTPKDTHIFYRNTAGQDVEIKDFQKSNIPNYLISKDIQNPQTRWTFSPVTTQQLTILQKVGEGSDKASNQMCVGQIWAY